MEHEVDLPHGRVTTGVVRIGEAVRRPTGPHSAFVHSLLALLAESGLKCAPRFHGLDERGREVLDYLDGWVPPDLEWRRWQDGQLIEAAQIVRSLHDASAGSALAGSAETVCHGDLSPCNFVFVDGQPRSLIDFDRAHPDSRRSDLAYMTWAWLVGDEDPTRSTPLHDRLRQPPIGPRHLSPDRARGIRRSDSERATRDSRQSRAPPKHSGGGLGTR